MRSPGFPDTGSASRVCSCPLPRQATDVPNLIEDAGLDVGSLTSLVYDVGTLERTQRIVAAVSTSPVEQFQVACTESEGFQGRPHRYGLGDVDSNIGLKHSWTIC